MSRDAPSVRVLLPPESLLPVLGRSPVPVDVVVVDAGVVIVPVGGVEGAGLVAGGVAGL